MQQQLKLATETKHKLTVQKRLGGLWMLIVIRGYSPLVPSFNVSLPAFLPTEKSIKEDPQKRLGKVNSPVKTKSTTFYPHV